MFLFHVSLPRPVHPRGALMRRRDVGRGRRLRPVERIHRAPRVSEDHRRLIRPPRTTAGPPWRAGSGSGDGRTRPTSRGLKPRARPGSGAETRPPTSRGGPWTKERRTFRSDPDAGSKGEARKGGAGANRGDAERLLKTRYESF